MKGFFGNSLVAGIAAGLYPLFHYYNGNFDIADTWVQFLFLFGICIVLPLVLIIIVKLFTKNTARLREFLSTAINLGVFSGLLSFFIFRLDTWIVAGIVAAAVLIGLAIHKHLSRIVILQFLLAAMSLYTLVPKLWFMMNHSNDWADAPDHIAEVTFKTFPNIYVIQPDGYTNFSELRKPPYNHEDTTFEDWLTERGFVNYPNYRSNYYSTLTSNASMFAMRHHYYGNTYRGNLKTFRSQDVIVGSNNLLEALKKNGYKTHLITDNSFFLTNRKLKGYDYCNIPQSEVALHDTGAIPGIKTSVDLNNVLEAATPSHNFYFIERTTPGHITYTEEASEGIEREREKYFERMKGAHVWLQNLIRNIQRLDKDPLIIVVADHGGFVGLNSVKEVRYRKLDSIETISAFSSQLSIDWPEGADTEDLEFRSNVNLFRNVLTYLSGDRSLLNAMEPDDSYLPLYEGSRASFYRCIDDTGNTEYTLVE